MPTLKRNATPPPTASANPAGFGPNTASWLAFWEQEYQRTGNPVFVWDALACVLSRGIPVPEASVEFQVPEDCVFGLFERPSA